MSSVSSLDSFAVEKTTPESPTGRLTAARTITTKRPLVTITLTFFENFFALLAVLFLLLPQLLLFLLLVLALGLLFGQFLRARGHALNEQRSTQAA